MKIGIDIGGSHISIGTVNENNQITIKIEKDIKISESENPKKILQENIINLIENMIDKVDEKNIELIGLACPRKYKRRKNNFIWQLKYKKYGNRTKFRKNLS